MEFCDTCLIFGYNVIVKDVRGSPFEIRMISGHVRFHTGIPITSRITRLAVSLQKKPIFEVRLVALQPRELDEARDSKVAEQLLRPAATAAAAAKPLAMLVPSSRY